MTVKGNIPKFYLVPIHHETDVEARKAKIQQRLKRLENGRNNLKADQRWPSQKSMCTHLYQQLNAVPEIKILPPTPRQRSGWGSPRPVIARPSQETLDLILAPTSTTRVPFPYHITNGAPAEEKSFLESSFIYFAFLPIELRLQIWEIELRRPKFIEAQLSSQFYSPTFVGACTRGPALLSVCRESRELALSLDGLFRYLTPHQRDFGRRWSRWPSVQLQEEQETALAFIPESDTVFFRGLDKPQGGLQSMACNVAGFENIQHLALPLQSSGLPLRNEWRMTLGLFRDLKTLTFLVGGKDQTWFGEEQIELRDVEEWFVDGRQRLVKVDRYLLDVGEVGSFLSGASFEQRMRGSWDDEWDSLNVRVVAWRKGT